MMKTAVKPDLKFKTFCSKESYLFKREKEIGLVSIKFYQKLVIAFISMSTFLIFPQPPRELENICVHYNSSELCNVW